MTDEKPAISPNVATRTLRKTSVNQTAGVGAASTTASPAPDARKTGTAKRGTKRAADGVTPSAGDEEAIKRSIAVAVESDDDDDERDEDGKRVYLGKGDQRRLLRVLTALSIPPATDATAEDPTNARKKAKCHQLILDQAFLDEQTHSSSSTLRGMLSDSEKVKVQDLVSHINNLATALAPTIPTPFPTDTTSNAQPNSRIAGSRAKPVKDSLLIEAFTTLIDVVSTVLSPQRSGDVAPVVPPPKVRWALHQRLGMVPSAGKAGPQTQTVDWFSGAAESVDVRDGDGDGDVDMDGGEESVLGRMKTAHAFGNANVVIVPPPVGKNDKSLAKPPTLNDILFVHPSRVGGKSLWKERRKQVKGNPQLRRIVQYPRYFSSFTPSFAPTHDSSHATSGFGYYQTWEAAMGKASVNSWLRSGWNSAYGDDLAVPQETEPIPDFRPKASKTDIECLLQTLAEDDAEIAIDPALVDAVDDEQTEMRRVQARLDQNAVWVRQLQDFQEIRVRRGRRQPLEEEDRIAQRLQESLVELMTMTTPHELLPKALRESDEPIAVVLARKVIHTSAPSIRGTLDPTRPKALTDNTTIIARAPDKIAPPIARPQPVNAVRPAPPPGMRVPPHQQWPGPQKSTPGNSPHAGATTTYSSPVTMQSRGRYTFPPQSTPGMPGRSSPIPPIAAGMPSVLRNALPQAVGVGSFSPVGRSTMTPGNPGFAGQAGQPGRGIGSSMGMSMNMNSPGIGGSPVPAFKPSSSMRG